MGGRCNLCNDPVGGPSGGVRCECGQHLHADCRPDHEDTCPDTGSEGWVGAQEF